MSCYFRHMRNILDQAGIEVSPGNRKEVDQAVHRIAGVSYKDCPATWRRLKQEIVGHEQKRLGLIQKLRSDMK